MNKRLLINNKNTPKTFKNIFQTNIINFDFENRVDKSKNIDKYISDLTTEYFLKIKLTEILYIKDNLSSNYLELLGLRLAYHIRLSEPLGNARYIPIVILSDIGRDLLNQLDISARILFTKNIFIIENTEEAINEFQDNLKCKNLTKDEYKAKFLNLIEIEAPKESHHDIANEWSIYKWGSFLNLEDPRKVQQNNEKINFMLYFKYLVAKYDTLTKSKSEMWEVPLELCAKKQLTILKKDAKILYIDDESINGWKDIFKAYFSVINENITLETLDGIEKITEYGELVKLVKPYMSPKAPDIILLDLRLLKIDHDKRILDKDISGIKLLKYIKEEINKGIQVILLTASGKSQIIEEAHTHDIIGYIKKEHPQDILASTTKSMDDLFCLVQRGYDRAYLKEIWELENKFYKIDLKKLIHSNNKSEDLLKIKEIVFEVRSVFNILNSDIKNRFIYAMFAIFKSIEIIVQLYIYEEDKKTYWRITEELLDNKKMSTRKKIIAIFNSKLGLSDKKIHKDIHNNLHSIITIRNCTIHPDGEDCEYKDTNINETHILQWFEMLQVILNRIDR